LIGGEPPGQYGRETRRQHKGENFAADPAFHFGYGLGLAQLAPHEKFPKQQGGSQGHPAVERAFLVGPQPATKEENGRVRCGQLRQKVEPGNGIADHRQKKHGQTEELNPLVRRRSATAGAHGPFGKNLDTTMLAVHGDLTCFRVMTPDECTERSARQMRGLLVRSATDLGFVWGLKRRFVARKDAGRSKDRPLHWPSRLPPFVRASRRRPCEGDPWRRKAFS